MTTFHQEEDGAKYSVWRASSRLRYILCDECICKNNITLSLLFPCCLESNLIFLNGNLQQSHSTHFLKTQFLLSQNCINNPNGKKSIAGSPSIVMKNSHLVHLVNLKVLSLNYFLKNTLINIQNSALIKFRKKERHYCPVTLFHLHLDSSQDIVIYNCCPITFSKPDFL